MWTNNIEAKIDTTQQNTKFWLCGNWHETINYIFSEWGKLVQKRTRLGTTG